MAAGSHNDCGGALFLKMYLMSDISLFAAADFTKQPFGYWRLFLQIIHNLVSDVCIAFK